jgi:hypothetical protein
MSMQDAVWARYSNSIQVRKHKTTWVAFQRRIGERCCRSTHRANNCKLALQRTIVRWYSSKAARISLAAKKVDSPKFGSFALACRKRGNLPSPVLYIQQCQVPRITQRSHPTNIVLLFEEARLERRPLLGLQHVIEGTVGHRDRPV